MSLRFEHAFTVKARPDKVWAYLTDPYRVAPALPGATITEKTGEGAWNGAITVKVGPVSARYRGTVRFEGLDAAARTATIVAKGQDVTGRGGADMKMESRLVEKAPGETEVTMVSEVNVTGIMAQFGRGLVQDVSNQMFQRFTEAARAELEKPDAPADETLVEAPVTSVALAEPAVSAPTGGGGGQTIPESGNLARSPAAVEAPAPVVAAATPAPPIEVLSFGTKILARAAGRMMRRPLFWVVMLAVAGLTYRLFVR